jgi:hypothetical protein
VPDDAALALRIHVLLRGLDTESTDARAAVFHAAVEQHKIVHQFQQARFVAQLEQVFVELEAGVVLFVFLPLQEVLLLGADGAVLQPFGVVAGKDKLHGAEEPGIEFGLLVGETLTDAVANADAAVLQFQHADGDAVDIQHQIGPALVLALEGDFLGNGKVVLVRLAPVDQVHGFGDLARFGFDGNAVAQQSIHRLVVAEQAAVRSGWPMPLMSLSSSRR